MCTGNITSGSLQHPLRQKEVESKSPVLYSLVLLLVVEHCLCGGAHTYLFSNKLYMVNASVDFEANSERD